jgi:AcrR family transcriptional regulator
MAGPTARVAISSDITRLTRSDRRAALLDAAAELLAAGDVDDVSMESVAKRVGVSRPLVYKHFANRQDLLSALYERESAHIHKQVSVDVQTASTSLADMLRALVRGMLAAQAARGATFAMLVSSGGRTSRQHEIQRQRDRQTTRFFTKQAMREFDLGEPAAKAAVSIALASVTAVLTIWRRNPTHDHAALLEDVYVEMAMGGLRALSDRHEQMSYGPGSGVAHDGHEPNTQLDVALFGRSHR